MDTRVRTNHTVVAFAPARAPVADVAVVMVVYRTGPVLFDAVDRVLKAVRAGELVLVDNGSSPEDAARLVEIAAREPRVRLLQGHGNVGFARGANLGASSATARWLVFLNPDALLEDGCLDALVAAAANRPAPCVVGARVLNPDRSEQRGARRGDVTPVTTLLTLSRLTAVFGFLRRFEIHHEDQPEPDGPAEVPTISGACFCMSRDDFHALGGFDGRYFLHVEDVDLCWRARQAGGTVWFQPQAEVVHLGHTSLAEPVFVEFHKGRGLARYFRKRADNPARLALAWALGPLIVMAAVLRPALRKITGKAG
ncbi:glycosyltransferase family 2 protein [Caulobacter sp. 17J65-9]|uniref:glycosyltransferase family 2 protein n=1 Tax=Caulobacter sp. 17J65-9 TaxID=2709382 RepID=UPI0013C9DC18|nr:glycosyltransferase family 2 protein [Caulobacter sp. 17J65-9]NEX92324.1 glycosyltransferase family 2 protein [Caulobacter sp. 17J65-9]